MMQTHICDAVLFLHVRSFISFSQQQTAKMFTLRNPSSVVLQREATQAQGTDNRLTWKSQADKKDFKLVEYIRHFIQCVFDSTGQLSVLIGNVSPLTITGFQLHERLKTLL